MSPEVMFPRHPYRDTPQPPREVSPRDEHARPLAWASAVLLVLCLARIGYGLAKHGFDGEVLVAMALGSAALLVLASALRTRG